MTFNSIILGQSLTEWIKTIKPHILLLISIEFYVPKNGLDVTKEIMYNSINMPCQNGKNNTRKSHYSIQQEQLQLERSPVFVFSLCLTLNLLLIMYSTNMYFLNFNIKIYHFEIRKYSIQLLNLYIFHYVQKFPKKSFVPFS